ncbi:hypothetical protein AHAS_Ahas17G0262400 [Arachis hypogaea]
MATENHAGGEFLHTKSQKPFDIEDYKIFIPFLDLKKLASHPFGICRGEPLRKDDDQIEPPYINIAGQKMSFDCAIYVMKWLEIIESKNIKKEKYHWENQTQVIADHFRFEYALRILFDEMNQDRDKVIKKSEAIKLSKPSAVLLSPYCQIDSDDIDSD